LRNPARSGRELQSFTDHIGEIKRNADGKRSSEIGWRMLMITCAVVMATAVMTVVIMIAHCRSLFVHDDQPPEWA
jgi:hypothetical protein